MRDLSTRQAASVSSLPAAGQPGRYAHFQGDLYHDNGDIWEKLSPSISDTKFSHDPGPGWILCGTVVSRATYARLFDKIGTVWGAGDGSTTFKAGPDQQRFPMHVSPAGSTGGSNTADLSHTHGKGSLSTQAAAGSRGALGIGTALNDATHTHEITGNTASSGDGAYDNRPAFFGMPLWMYAGK